LGDAADDVDRAQSFAEQCLESFHFENDISAGGDAGGRFV